MLTLPDGRLLVATGDNAPFGLDGRAAPQDDSEHVAKLLLIDPDTGAIEVAAKGVRNVQQMTFVDGSGNSKIAFTDIGAVTAEEVNVVDLADLLDTSTVENFGWGRAADGKAREGTFYIAPGEGLTGGSPPAEGMAPVGEAGYLQPFAQWNRDNPGSFAAITGPVTSTSSFTTLTSVFADLVSGTLMGTTTALDSSTIATSIFEIGVVDAAGQDTSLFELAGGTRPDPRFFQFADGGAGVLLEETGDYYRLTELNGVSTVPLPASALLLMGGFAGLGVVRRRRQTPRPSA